MTSSVPADIVSTVFAGPSLLALAAGTVCGLVAGLTPGINGRVALMLTLPLALMFGPVAGAVFLVAMHSVVHTSGAIPAILLGVPTSPTEAATIIDGHAMTRKGRGAQAIGVIVGASMAGGIIGALVLLLLAPMAPAVVRFIGAPEVAALSILGLLSIAALSGGGLAGGLMSAALGVLVASIGVDVFSGADRFTFGRIELMDGVSAAAVVTGLFVTPELLLRHGKQGVAMRRPPIALVLAGVAEAFRHRWLLLRTSLIGALVGFAPGMGASVAVWLAYGHARQTHVPDTPYGEGAVAGVLAPEAANNSKEGGALAPALFLGIPTSSGMGILLAAFATLGVEVGPRLLTTDLGFVYVMGLTNVASNVLAAPVCILLAPVMVRFASLRPAVIGPVALALAVAAAALTAPGTETLVMIAIFSAIGLALKAADLPRAPLLLGFVLAPNLESGLIRAASIHGWEAFARPGVVLVLLLGLAALAPAMIRFSAPRTVAVVGPAPAPSARGPVTGSIAVAGVAAVVLLWDLPLTARLVPGIAAGVGLCAAGVAAFRLWQGRGGPSAPSPEYDRVALGLLVLMLCLAPFAGLAVASTVFVFVALRFIARLGYPVAGAVALGVGLGIYLLSMAR